MRPEFRGRGTGMNPENRYERIHFEPEPGDDVAPATVLYRDTSKSALAENHSPDVGFRFSLNPYRGCEHGCIYCYARPTHEYLSFSAGLDFERRIMVKHDAPALLREAFLRPRWQPQTVALSGNTDCYQPVERRLQLTRRCLAIFTEFLNPVSIITKSALVARDIDLLQILSAVGAVHVVVSVTTLDPEIARRMEPRAAQPEKRLEAIRALSAAGIPTGILIAPLIPGLNDAEVPRIMDAAAAAGARNAGYVLLRLPQPVDELFDQWLREQLPERRIRILGRIRQCREGNISDAQFGRRMRGTGVYARHLAALVRATARRAGLDQPLPPLDPSHFRRPATTPRNTQLQLL